MLRDLRENRNGLVGHWLPAWETPALVDASGRGNTATNSGSTIAGSSRGPVRTFTGATPIEVPDRLDHDLIGDHACFAWIRAESLSSPTTSPLILDKRSSNNYGWTLRIVSSKIWHQWDSADVTGVTTLTTGRWYHVGGVISGGVGQVYVDGHPDGPTDAGLGSGFARAADLHIGSVSYGASSGGLNGNISDVQLFNRALPAAEVRDLYERTKSPRLPRRRVYSLPAAPPAGNRRRRLLIGSG